MVAAFRVGIPVEVTQEAGVVPRCRRAVIGTYPVLDTSYNTQGKGGFILSPIHRGLLY